MTQYAARPATKGHQISFSIDSQQPKKKLKSDNSTGNLIARYLSKATGGAILGNRPSLQQIAA
jgi:hypothetical protein